MPRGALSDETVDLLVVRIDAQDTSFIVPIREFLAAYGCRVVVNPARGSPSTYHLICGDGEFVKSFVGAAAGSQQKTFIIICDPTIDATQLSPPAHAKVVLLDPRPLTAAQVKEIFTFFFTSRQNLMDGRKTRSSTRVNLAALTPVRREEARVPLSDESRITETIAKVFSDQPKSERRQSRSSRRRWWLVGLVLVTWPFWWFALAILVSGLSLGMSSKLLSSSQTGRASQLATLATVSSNQASFTLGLVAASLRTVGLDSWLRGQEEVVSLFTTLARAELGMARMFSLSQGVAAQVLSPRAATAETPLASTLTQLRIEMATTETYLALSQATLTSLLDKRRFPFGWSPLFQLGASGQARLARLHRQLILGQRLLTLYLHFSGFREKQTYLVLLQNSMELRPTGGFVGSLAEVSFENGKLADLVIQDVYVVDGQLKGHVAPPLPIKEVLGQEHWYLRDSNWDPDFRMSGEKAAWFYEKETGVKVDGVIAVSLPFIVDLLRLTGPLTLADFNDRITSENFFAKAIFYTQVDFFPGSTQKKNFLGSLATSLLTALVDSHVPLSSMWQVLTEGLESHNLLFSFVDRALEDLVESYGWAGGVIAEEKLCQAEAACFSDFLYPVEANLGVNKTNYFLFREVLDQITISADGTASHTLTVNYRNTSTGAPDGGGTYRSYTRFLLPRDATTNSLLLDGVPLPTPPANRKTAPPLPYAELLATPSAYLTLALVFEVPPRGEKQMVISYRRGKPLPLSPSGGVLEFFLQKQPGLINTKWQTIVTYPITWEARSTNSIVAKPGELEYNSNLARDQWIRVLFSPRQ